MEQSVDANHKSDDPVSTERRRRCWLMPIKTGTEYILHCMSASRATTGQPTNAFHIPSPERVMLRTTPSEPSPTSRGGSMATTKARCGCRREYLEYSNSRAGRQKWVRKENMMGV